MFQASIYGRLGNDPKEIVTSTGTTMALCNVIVTLDCNERDINDLHSEFISIVAFGKVADNLLKNSKGDCVALSGVIRYKTYNNVRQLVILADSCISAKTVNQAVQSPIIKKKPSKAKAKQSPKKKKKAGNPTAKEIEAAQQLLSSIDTNQAVPINPEDIPFNDEIPF